MNNSREEIPQWTWYNGQFLFKFDEQLNRNPNKTIGEFFNDFLESQNMKGEDFYHTKNQGTVILLMYGLLVVPREIWEKTQTSFVFATRNNFVVKIQPDESELDTLNFLRLLRNSLSHANFEIDITNATLTFWNNPDKNDIKRNFEVTINYNSLGEFLTEIGKYYINEVKNAIR
jgi:hypothetical protein